MPQLRNISMLKMNEIMQGGELSKGVDHKAFTKEVMYEVLEFKIKALKEFKPKAKEFVKQCKYNIVL